MFKRRLKVKIEPIETFRKLFLRLMKRRKQSC